MLVVFPPTFRGTFPFVEPFEFCGTVRFLMVLLDILMQNNVAL
jgi:hypothetical protein